MGASETETMCGRFTQHFTWTEVHAFLDVFGPARNLQPRYNIAPTTTIDVIRLDREGRRELVPMRWGLVPFFWRKTLKDMPATFNARAETVHAGLLELLERGGYYAALVARDVTEEPV